jgi:hypothetical protein
METRTSDTPHATVRDPRLTALQIDLSEIHERLLDLLCRLETAHERCQLSLQVPGILDGLSSLTGDVSRAHKKLDQFRYEADPSLSQIFFRSLHTQS